MNRVYAATILQKLLSLKAASPSPVSVRDVPCSISPKAALWDTDAMCDGDALRNAFAAAVSSSLADITARCNDKTHKLLKTEADDGVNDVMPVESLLKVVIRVFQEQSHLWSKATGAVASTGRASTPPAIIQALPQGSPSLPKPTDTTFTLPPTTEHSPSSTSSVRSDSPPLEQSLTPSLQSVSAQCNGVSIEALYAMWSPIACAIVRMLTHVQPTHRDGSVREEYYGIVAACIELCKWPSLLAASIQCLVKSWPHKSTRYACSV